MPGPIPPDSGETAALYERVFETHPQAMLVSDRRTRRILAANTAATETYGYSRQEFLDLTIDDIDPGAGSPSGPGARGAVADGGVPSGVRSGVQSGVWQHRLKDGRVAWVEVTSHAIDVDGRPADLICVRDVIDEAGAPFWNDHVFRQFADAIPQIIWTATPDGTVDFASKALYDYAGLSREELPPGDWPVIAHRDDLDRVLAIWSRSLSSGQPHRAEFRLRAGDGEYRWHLVIANPIRDDGGDVTKWYGVATDIHDRKLAEERLGRAEVLLRVAADVGRIGGWRIDLAADTVEWSDELCAMHSVPPGSKWSVEEATGFSAPEWLSRARDAIDACIREGIPFEIEKENVSACGRRFWVRMIGEAVRDETGGITHIQGAIQDITERKAAQDWSEQQFRRIADDIPLGIWTAAPDGTLDYANRTLYEQVGTTPEQLPPWDWPRIVHPDDRERAVAEESAAYAIGEAFSVEMRLRMADGSHRWFIDSGRPVRDGEGRIVKWYGAIVDVHEQKEAEEQRRELETRFRQLAENITEVFWMTDPVKNEILYVSPGYEAIWGRPRAELQANRAQWHEAIHSEDRDRVIEAARHHASGSYDEEYRIIRPDGEIRWILDRAFPVRDDTGRVYRIAGLARDITGSKLAEEALRDSELRFHAVANAVTDVVWDWDLVADEIWWGPGLKTDFGYGEADVDPSPAFWKNRIHLDDWNRVLAGIEASFASSDSLWEDEYRFLHADGTYRHVRDHGSILRDPTGRPVRFIGGLADVTDRKRAEWELAVRVKELRCLYRALEITMDNDRTVEAACKDIVAILPEGFVHPDLAVARIVMNGNEWTSEGWQPPAANLRNRIVTDGDEVGFVEVGYAIAPPPSWPDTEIFLAEERELLNGVALHVGRMITARKLAEHAAQSERIRAVGQITGGVAHDFNNLLTVILGNAELLVDGLAGETQLRRFADTVLTAAERGADLTNRLLAFARQQPLDPRPTEIDRLLHEMRDSLLRTLGEQIEIEIVSGAAPWQAQVDRLQLENALLNLCINGRDAMPEGGRLTIEIENAHLDQHRAAATDDVSPGEYVVIAVTDTGTGMPEYVARRAFEPFFTTKPVGQGSGLGLSMVFGFAKQSKGHATIWSEPGQGTTIRIYLPRAADDD